MHRICLSAATAAGLVACATPVAEPVAEPTAAPEVSQLPGPVPGWGAVFWRDGIPWQRGGATRVVGPRAVADVVPLTPAPSPSRCGGTAVDGAPKHAVVALPQGVSGDTPTKPPIISAATVEATAWRLDEKLPARDKWSPVDPNAAPAAQRGVQVGSVVKVRRYGGPPVLAVAGSRDCTGIVALLDREATTTWTHHLLPGICGTPHLLPPTDIDGDGQLETVVFDDEHVVVARLDLTPATADLTVLGHWACPLPESP